MDDFASALVLAMVRRSLARQSIEVPAPTSVGDRTVRIAEKQALLDAVLDTHGPKTILRVADIVPEFADHPVAGVFAGCRTPSDVVASWIAIERYFHSRHRTRVVVDVADRIVMEHFDTRGSKISAGENIAVAGLILGIMRWRGANGVVLNFGDAPSPAGSAATADQTHRWTIAWQRFEPPPGASPAWHECSVPAVDFTGRAVSDPYVARLFAEQLGTLHARRSAAATARAAGLSLRTLQRRLAGAGWSLGDIAASARVHVATRLLASTETPLALVGLLAGYSDQPHFQRSFRAAVGPTPAEYRRLASRGLQIKCTP
ncbi:MAG: AraC family transcriptional regulator [Rhizobiaceae bacterium]|nr:AraC family transcriptional regulator [Rhizobiaceae bacterium]MCV0408402.1 AraC family transcriptional regulator [Rhizobiaceae bacterium]